MKRLGLLCISIWIAWHGSISLAWADNPNEVLSEASIPTQLVIPEIELDTRIVPVGIETIEVNGQIYPIWETTENDIGWHQGSGPPGHSGNTVLSGHSNGGQEIFRNLEELEIGSDIHLATDNGWHHYRVAEIIILREQGEPAEVRTANAQWILPQGDERLTLVTCWPYPSSTHRLLVIAYPTSDETRQSYHPELIPPPELVSDIEITPNPELLPTTSITSQPNLTLAPELEQQPRLQLQPKHQPETRLTLAHQPQAEFLTRNSLKHFRPVHIYQTTSTSHFDLLNAHLMNDIKG